MVYSVSCFVLTFYKTIPEGNKCPVGRSGLCHGHGHWRWAKPVSVNHKEVEQKMALVYNIITQSMVCFRHLGLHRYNLELKAVCCCQYMYVSNGMQRSGTLNDWQGSMQLLSCHPHPCSRSFRSGACYPSEQVGTWVEGV